MTPVIAVAQFSFSFVKVHGLMLKRRSSVASLGSLGWSLPNASGVSLLCYRWPSQQRPVELLQRDEPARLRGHAGQLFPHPPVQQLLQPAPARPLGKARGARLGVGDTARGGGRGSGWGTRHAHPLTAPTRLPVGPRKRSPCTLVCSQLCKNEFGKSPKTVP